MSDMEHQRRRFSELTDDAPATGPGQEAEHFTERRDMRKTDSDRDGLSDYEEAGLGTDAFKKDTDGDRVEDGWERAMGLDPLDPDTDRDGAWDGQEILNRTDPKHKDGPSPRRTLEEQSQRTSPMPAGTTPATQSPTAPPQNAMNPVVPNPTGLDIGGLAGDLLGGDLVSSATSTAAGAAGAAAAPPVEAPSTPTPGQPLDAPGGRGSPFGSVLTAAPGRLAGPPATADSPVGPDVWPPAAAGLGPVGGLLGSRTLPAQQNRSGTTLQRQFEDGTAQTITVDNDGRITRTTTRLNPSTGAEVVDTRLPDGTRIHRQQLPGGNSIEVTTHPDGTTEKTQFFRNSDGSVTTSHTDRDGWSTAIRQGQDPDGTVWEEKLLPPDNRTERRTTKETRQPDGSVLRETTAPEGMGREISSADGRRYESVFTFTDGRQETSKMVTNEDGSTLTTNIHANGRWETIRKETLPNGTVRETLTPDRGSTEITLTTTLKNADNSTTIDIDGPDSTHRTTTWPDGATESTVTYNDGTSERTASGFHPDGSKWHFTEKRDGSWERVEQPLGATGALISRSDGTVIEQTFGDRIGLSILRPDGAREKTDLDLDGAGTTQVTDATGRVVSETVHEGTPVQPFPDLGHEQDIPILSEAAVADLDDRGVVGRLGGAAGTKGGEPDPAGDLVGDVAIPDAPPPRLLEEGQAARPSGSAPEPEVTRVEQEPVGLSLSEPEPVRVSAPEPVAEPAWDQPAYASEPERASEPEPSFDSTSDLDT